MTPPNGQCNTSQWNAESSARMRYILLTFMCFLICAVAGDILDVSFGKGCPRRPVACTKYCRGFSYYGGFCLKVVCVCAPRLTSNSELNRAWTEIKEKINILLKDEKPRTK